MVCSNFFKISDGFTIAKLIMLKVLSAAAVNVSILWLIDGQEICSRMSPGTMYESRCQTSNSDKSLSYCSYLEIIHGCNRKERVVGVYTFSHGSFHFQQ